MKLVFKIIYFILRHPLNRHQPLTALKTFLRWQIGSRFLPGAVAVPFVERTRLLTTPGMTVATGNLYCGLFEFEEMGFILHALRPDDIFVDVGANVGAYTILAAGACGAEVIAVEPVTTTFAHLMDNIRLNNLESLVTAKNIGLGANPGTLTFSTAMGAMNHVLAEDENLSIDRISIDGDTLNALCKDITPTMIKIDVEGYETEVIQGARDVLQVKGLIAVLMELNGNGARYRFDEAKLHTEMLKEGFTSCSYDPFSRVLTPLETWNRSSNNTLYVRDIPLCTARVQSAPPFTIHGKRL